MLLLFSALNYPSGFMKYEQQDGIKEVIGMG